MRLAVLSGAAVAVVAAAGCGGSDHGSSNIPDAIAASIGSVCTTKVTRTALPSESGHSRFEALALNKTVIGCQGKPGNQSEYTRFADRRTALSALDSIRLRPAHVESFCVAGSEAFTTDFVGSDPVCHEVHGHYHNVRRPPIPFAVTHHTYIPICGTAMNLRYHPAGRAGWDGGCTAGSDRVGGDRWTVWNQKQAIVSGRTALRGPCAIGGKSRGPCTGQNALYRTRATVRLHDPQNCVDQGVTLRYFRRATFRAFMKPDNPFGYRPGWHIDNWKVETFRDECGLSKEGTLFGKD